MKLSVKMLLFCLLIGILPLAGMAGYSLNTASKSLEEQAYSKLASIKEARLHDLAELTDTWDKDITMFSEARYVYSTLVRLRDIVFYAAKPGKRMDINDEEYAHAMKRVMFGFTPWVKVRGYADALILDDTGRIVFSVKQGDELGEDITNGPLSSSKLVGAWKRALKGEVVIIDFHPYAPLNGEPCAFIAAPIRRYGKEIEGVAMLRISTDSVADVMSIRAGMGETGEAYLVGQDTLMRSDLFSDQEVHSVIASFRNPDRGMMTTKPALAALSGQKGSMDALDYRGHEVLSAFAPVQVGDTTWGMVAKIDASEALAPVHRLKQAAMVVGAGTVAGVVLVTLIFLRFTLLRPLNWLREYAGRVAEGDLEYHSEGNFKGELKQVNDAIELMVHNLGDKMQEAEAASQLAESRAAEAELALESVEAERKARAEDARAQREGMLQAAGMLANVVAGMKSASRVVNVESDRILEGADSLSKRVETTASSMEQLSGSIHEVADSAASASTEAKEARERARHGSEIVRKTVSSIGEVHAITDELKEQAGTLGAKADSIGRVISVISDIADQTNLLALNAAIEAARAGDAGRGFAVVADEVRKLAEKTMDATREVGDSISAIQADVRENITGMDRAAKSVETANDLAGESGAALIEIIEFFDATAVKVDGIAAACSQQSSASEEINQAVSDVDMVSTETAEAVGETSTAITELTDQIDTLSKLYGLFMLIGEGVVQEEVNTLAAEQVLATMNRAVMEPVIQKAVVRNPSLEMAWVTDMRGIQVTDFALAHGKIIGDAGAGPGTDWSHREWCSETLRTREPYISNIYYSDIIEDYCLTVAAPIRDAHKEMVGLLAVDVRYGEEHG